MKKAQSIVGSTKHHKLSDKARKATLEALARAIASARSTPVTPQSQPQNNPDGPRDRADANPPSDHSRS
jgi:hypothetical protein